MKKLVILFTLSFFSIVFVNAQEQPDYTQIKFRQKVKEYKKSTPKLEGLEVDKELISNIVRLLGSSYYNEKERNEIVERIWLSFTDPKKFDMVFRDYAIRTLPNWNKKNFRGEIVLEPNPYLSDWTQSDKSVIGGSASSMNKKEKNVHRQVYRVHTIDHSFIFIPYARAIVPAGING